MLPRGPDKPYGLKGGKLLVVSLLLYMAMTLREFRATLVKEGGHIGPLKTATDDAPYHISCRACWRASRRSMLVVTDTSLAYQF